MRHLTLADLKSALRYNRKIRFHPGYYVEIGSEKDYVFTIIKLTQSGGSVSIRYKHIDSNFVDSKYINQDGRGEATGLPMFVYDGPEGNDGRINCKWCNIKTKSVKIDALDRVFDYCPECGR